MKLVQHLLLFWLLFFSATIHAAPHAEQGILDLSAWQTPEEGYALIEGEWLFFWEKLLPTKDLNSEQLAEGLPVAMQHTWKGMEVNGLTIRGQGYASYYLKIIPPTNTRPLALFIPNYRLGYSLWVNGQLMAESGTVSPTASTASKHHQHHVIPLPVDAASYEVVIHSSNYISSIGGLPQGAWIGTTTALTSYLEFAMFPILIGLGAALFFAIKYLLLYLNKRRYTPYLVLGFFSLVIVLNNLVWTIPHLSQFNFSSHLIATRIIILTSLLIQPLYITFIHALYPQTASRGLSRAMWLVTALMTLLILFGPDRLFVGMVALCIPLLGLFFSTVVFLTWKKEKSPAVSFLSLIALLILSLFYIHDMMWVYGVISTPFPIAFNAAIIALVLAIMLDQYDIDAFEQVKVLSNNLADKVEEKTRDLSKKLSDLSQKEHELSLAYYEIEKANQSKSRFLAATSHDLRQPLHSIGMQLDQLESLVDDPKAGELIAQIKNSQANLGNTLNALLDISRIDSGSLDIHRSHFSVHQFLQRVRDEFTHLAQKRGIELRLHPSHEWGYSDTVLLFRVMTNLLDNAIKYGDQSVILIAARKQNKHISLEVWNCGEAIPKEKQKSIFEEFTQLNNPNRDQQNGLGLGLSIVQRLCRLLDHPISLYSKESGLTGFKVAIPYGEETSSEITTATATANMSQQFSLQGCVVLLIENDELVLQATSSLLRSWKCAVLEARSYDEALQQAVDEEIDIIIADYTLADGHTGIDAIEAIKATTQSRAKSLIITAETQADIIATIKEKKQTYLNKPVTAMTLRSTLHRFCKNRQ